MTVIHSVFGEMAWWGLLLIGGLLVPTVVALALGRAAALGDRQAAVARARIEPGGRVVVALVRLGDEIDATFKDAA